MKVFEIAASYGMPIPADTVPRTSNICRNGEIEIEVQDAAQQATTPKSFI
jgi:hypothetical protein